MVQISDTATGVAIIGMMNRVRKKPRPRNFLWNTRAEIVPSTIGRATARMVK